MLIMQCLAVSRQDYHTLDCCCHFQTIILLQQIAIQKWKYVSSALSIERIQHRSILLLTLWGRVTHICVSKQAIIGSENGLSPGRCQVIIWTCAGLLVIWTFGNKLQWNLNKNLYIFIQENAFENVVWKMAAILSRPQCVELILIIITFLQTSISKLMSFTMTRLFEYVVKHFQW